MIERWPPDTAYAALAGLLYLLPLRFVGTPWVCVMSLLVRRGLLGGAESVIITGAATWGLVLAGPRATGIGSQPDIWRYIADVREGDKREGLPMSTRGCLREPHADGIFLRLNGGQIGGCGCRKLDRLMPIVTEIEQIADHRNSPLKSRARISDGLSARCLSVRQKIFLAESASYHASKPSSGSGRSCERMRGDRAAYNRRLRRIDRCRSLSIASTSSPCNDKFC